MIRYIRKNIVNFRSSLPFMTAIAILCCALLLGESFTDGVKRTTEDFIRFFWGDISLRVSGEYEQKHRFSDYGILPEFDHPDIQRIVPLAYFVPMMFDKFGLLSRFTISAVDSKNIVYDREWLAACRIHKSQGI